MTYDYKCPECTHEFEVVHGMIEEPEVNCPVCETKSGRIITGGSGFTFKCGGATPKFHK